MTKNSDVTNKSMTSFRDHIINFIFRLKDFITLMNRTEKTVSKNGDVTSHVGRHEPICDVINTCVTSLSKVGFFFNLNILVRHVTC